MTRFLYKPAVARVIAVVATVYLIYYLAWRATETLNPSAIVFSLALLLAEAQGFVNGLLFTFMTWDLETSAPFELRPGLSVDIFVPTYDEDLEILEATLTGCAAIRYPHTTYVLDDGRRPEVEGLALRLGCRYLTRADNRHAKAGNLNAALARTSGEFIVVLDADTVPQPDFLDRTLGYFVDERLALVQLPQEFYNLDSVQHRTGSHEREPWHEQSLFYRVIQPGKNRCNAAFWCGSPSVLRRVALEDVGGVATDTVTEDIHTTVRLQARGWRTWYHNEALAYGIAPQTMRAFLVQRLRWAQGTMQLLRSRENPLIFTGLTPAQRLNYLASMGTYFDAFQKLLYILAPSLILVTGVLPLKVGGGDFLLHWLPYMLLGALANVALGRGSFRYLRVEQYNLLKMFAFLWASTVVVWPRRLRFAVTPKRTDHHVYMEERRQVLPHVLLLSFVVLTGLLGVANLLWGLTTSYSDTGIILVTLGWTLTNAGILALGVENVLGRLHARASYRFPTHLGAYLAAGDSVTTMAETENLSRSGVRLVVNVDVARGEHVGVSLQLPDGAVTLPGEVVYRRVLEDGRCRLGIHFLPLGAEDRQRLVAYLYVVVPRQQRAAAGSIGGITPPPELGATTPTRATA